MAIPESIHSRFLLVFCATLGLGACATAPPSPPPPPVKDMVAAIRAAGQRDTSTLQVTPLRDPGVQSLADRARSEQAGGRYAQAAKLLDQALAKEPGAPDLLQDRAELAIYLHHFAHAEELARASWSHGPRLGRLCSRNWQTVMEMRFMAHDPAGVAAARKQRDDCRVKPVTRM
jgi:hypothetical protein